MTNLNTNAPVATTGLRFDEEFNTFSSSVDGKTGTWMTTYPYGGESANTLPSNGEGEYYGSAASGSNSPFSLSNGILNITASKAPAGSNPYGLPYTSGLITTDGSYSQTYGYFEVSAKLPAGAGLWPAFWMLPVAVHDNTELDVFEMLGSSPSTIYSSTHGPTGGVSQQLSVPDTSTAFHTYGVDWEPSTVTFYMDGAKVASTPTPASMNQPMYMLLNLAVGGSTSWPGAPNAATAFPSTMQIDYVRAYATSATIYSGGSAALPPAVTPAVVTPPMGTVVLGSGPDVLALQVAEDAYAGDAQYTVSVDGKQVGGVLTATASHGAGATQALDVMGSFGPGTHTATVNFLNDAWGGSSATDRNLYVTQASLDNTAIPASSLAEFSGGPQSFTFQGAAAPVDTLILGVSEDAWNGDAQYTVSVDGKQAGGVYSAKASHAAGQITQQTITGSWGGGAHAVGITFINDAWGGSGADRNLYVNAVNYDGAAVAMGTIAQYSNGTANILTPAAANPNILTLHMAEDAYQGDAQFTVAIDGKQVGGTQTVTASNAKGATQAFSFAGALGTGSHDVAVSFLNDAYGGSPTQDRNLHVAGADLNGSAQGAAAWTAALYSNGTTHFGLVVP